MVIGVSSGKKGEYKMVAGQEVRVSTENKPGKVKTVKAKEEDFAVVAAADGSGVIIKEYLPEIEGPDLSNIVIPNKIQGMPVVQLGELNGSGTPVFKKGHIYLAGVVIPDTVKIIGCNALSTGFMEKLDIPKSVKVVSSYAFSRLPLKKVTLRADIDWSKEVDGMPACGQFHFCQELEEITIEDGIEIITESMFDYSSIKKIVIPASVKSIGRDAFANCKELVDVELKSPDTKIHKTAFEGCPKLSLKSQQEIEKRTVSL